MKDTIKIGDHIIGSGRAFIIAEIGNNHNGSFDRAIQMIDQAVEMQADCVKFQMRHLDQLYRKKSIKKSGEDLGTEYVLDLLRKFELTVGEQEKLSDYCKEKGILYVETIEEASSSTKMHTYVFLFDKKSLVLYPLLHP